MFLSLWHLLVFSLINCIFAIDYSGGDFKVALFPLCYVDARGVIITERSLSITSRERVYNCCCVLWFLSSDNLVRENRAGFLVLLCVSCPS